MSFSKLYLGPYNDPGGVTGRKHWELPHDFDCRNPAFVVRKANHEYSMKLQVRNRSELPTIGDVAVNFYGAGLLGVATRDSVDALVADLLQGKTPNRLTPPTSFTIGTDGIAPYSLACDRPWIAGPALFHPMAQKGIVLVATVKCLPMGVQPELARTPTLDPCVAVWIGP
jgi:hypothetical protein